MPATYVWTDEAALNVITENGQAQSVRDIVARYLKFRLEGYAPDAANAKLALNQYTLVYRHRHSGTKYKAFFEAADMEDVIRKHRNNYTDTDIIEIRKD